MAVKFLLKGKELVYDWDTEIYTKLRNKFFAKKNEVMKEFNEAIRDVPNGEECVEVYPSALGKAVYGIYNSFEDMFIERGCFSFSADMLENDSVFNERVLQPLEALINDLADSIDSADLYKEAESERRAMRKAGRGRVIGGGFGMGGFVKGALTAGAINGVTGLAHGLFNAVGNVATSMEVSNMKNEAYSKFKIKFSDSVDDWVNVVRDILIKQLDIKVAFNYGEAESIIKNIDSGKIKEEYLSPALLRCLECYPYDINVYARYLDVVPADEEVIFKMTEHFGLDANWIRENIHNFDGVYFDSGEVKKDVKDVTCKILLKTYEQLSNTTGDVSKNFSGSNQKDFCDILTEKYWLNYLNEDLPEQLSNEFERAASLIESSQAKEYFQNKSNFFHLIKEQTDAKLAVRAEILSNAYFQDIIKEIVVVVPGEGIKDIEELPNILEDHLDCAYRGYLKDFKVSKENVYFLCNRKDSMYSDMSNGFALTYEGLLCSTGKYFLYEQISDIRLKGDVLCVVDTEGKENDFVDIPDNPELRIYLTKVFSYIFHPETMPEDVFEKLRVRLNA